MKKKVLSLLLVVAMVCTLLPMKSSEVHATGFDFYISNFLDGFLDGGKLVEGAYYSFDLKTVIFESGNNSLINSFNNNDDPDLYFWNAADSDPGYDITLLSDSDGIVSFYVPTGTAGKSFHFVFLFDNTDGYESETFNITKSTAASVNTETKTITLNKTRLPLPGKKYGEVSVAGLPLTKHTYYGDYFELNSTLRIPVGSGKDYITLYERWEKYHFPNDQFIATFSDNTKYFYDVIADFSNAGVYKDDYRDYKIVAPNAEFYWSATELTDEVDDYKVIFSAVHTNGVDEYESVDMGKFNIDLTNGDLLYQDSKINERNTAEAIMTFLLTLSTDGVISYDFEPMTYTYNFDLDKDGNHDVYIRLIMPGDSKMGLIEGSNLYGDYTLSLSEEELIEKKTSQMGFYCEAITFSFKTIPFVEKEMTVSGIKVKSYAGVPVTQDLVVKFGNETLKENVDYEVLYENNNGAGMATLTVVGKGKYSGTITRTFKINKGVNPLKVKGKTATVKASKVKKKNQKLAVSKVIKFTKKGQGKLTYKKLKGNKKILVNKKTGKITVKKGLKKGTYKVRVSIKAAGNKNYLPSATKKVTFKIRVK